MAAGMGGGERGRGRDVGRVLAEVVGVHTEEAGVVGEHGEGRGGKNLRTG